jgi:capsular exopolysaccharide synthesis family protein
MTGNEITPAPSDVDVPPAAIGAHALAWQRHDWRVQTPNDLSLLAQESFLQAVHEFFRVLRRFKWAVLGILVAVMTIGAAATLLSTRLYTASVRLEIESSAAKIVQKGEVSPVEARDFEFLRTQYELLQSRNIAERTVAALKLADDPELSKPGRESAFARLMKLIWPEPPAKTPDRATIERGIAGAILANRVVKPVPGSRLLDLAYTDPNPARAAAITMGLANEFIGSIRDKRFEATAYAKTFLEDQLQQLRAKLQDSENALIDYSEKEQIVGTASDKTSIAEANLAAANTTLGQIVTERMRNEQQYRQIENATVADLPQFLNDKLIEDLRDRRNALVVENQEKDQLLRPDYPTMVQLNNKIKETDKQIADQIRVIKVSLKGAYEASLKQEEDVKKRVDQLRTEVIELQKRSIHFNILKREADSNRTIYEDLLQRYKEVDVAGGIAASNVFIVDRAEVPTSPSSPNLSRNMLVSMLLGLVAGLAGAFLLERLDNTVSKIDEFERVSGLPSLGVIPLVPPGSTLEEEMNKVSSDIWEAYRTLCTSLQFVTDKGLPKSLFFTSANVGEGKSTSSLAVARYFGNLGLKVLLIDCDLRRPSLHKKLGLSNEKGLTNYLTGGCSAEDVSQSSPFANLTFLASGPLPPNASELLASPKFGVLIAKATADFDLVVVDGPPIMGLADAQLLSKATQATIFAARAGYTAKHNIRAALKRLHAARCYVIGGMLTRYEAKNEAQSYEYGYAYSVDADSAEGSTTGRLMGGIRALLSR